MTITLEDANEALHHSKSITLEAFEALRAAVVAREWDRVMAMCAGSFNGVIGCIWSNAMTAKYGPGQTHASRCNPDGTPTAETLAAFPWFFDSMRDAEDAIVNIYLWQVEKAANENAAA